MTKIYFTFLFSLLVTISLAQKASCNCFLKGVVKDQHTGLPVVGATVLITELNKVIFTNEKGEYALTNLCPGNYQIECRIVGYSPFRQTINLKEGHEENFTLTEEEIHLHDVEITTHRSEALASQPVTTLTGRDLFQKTGENLAESLKGLTGVTAIQTGSSISKPVIHGMHSNRILIMNNGVRQEGQQWGSEHAPEIDPFVATRLSVVKGAAGVRYGSDAIGGVILVDPEELPYQKRISGEVNAVGFANGRQGVVSGTMQGGFKNFAWRAQGTLKRGGNIKTPDYYLDNTGIKEENFSLAAGYRKKGFGVDLFYSQFVTQIGIFSGSHIGSVTDLLNIIKNGEPFVKSDFTYTINRPNQNIKHHLMKAETHYHFNDGNKIQWTIAQQVNNRNEYDLHGPRNDSLAALNHPELAFKLNTLTNDLVWDHKPLLGKISGQMGLSSLYQYNLMKGRPLIPNFNQFNIGLFWIERYSTSKWELEAGVRYDVRSLKSHRMVKNQKVSNEFNFSNFSGTIGALRNISPNWSASLNLGSTWRAPNVSELFSDGVHHGAAAYEKGDSTLMPEKALNSTLSVKYSSSKLSVELGGFYNYLFDYIYLMPQPEPILTVRGAFPYFKYRQTDAIFRGIDLSVEWNATKRVSLISKLSYLNVYDQKKQDYLVMIPANRWDNQIRYSLGSVKNWKDVYVSAGNLLVARQKRVPLNSDYLAPPKGYSIWNIQAGTTIPLSDKNQLEINIGVQNLFNLRYRDYLNRFRYYADEMGRQVSLRLKWKFST